METLISIIVNLMAASHTGVVADTRNHPPNFGCDNDALAGSGSPNVLVVEGRRLLTIRCALSGRLWPNVDGSQLEARLVGNRLWVLLRDAATARSDGVKENLVRMALPDSREELEELDVPNAGWQNFGVHSDQARMAYDCAWTPQDGEGRFGVELTVTVDGAFLRDVPALELAQAINSDFLMPVLRAVEPDHHVGVIVNHTPSLYVVHGLPQVGGSPCLDTLPWIVVIRPDMTEPMARRRWDMRLMSPAAGLPAGGQHYYVVIASCDPLAPSPDALSAWRSYLEPILCDVSAAEPAWSQERLQPGWFVAPEDARATPN